MLILCSATGAVAAAVALSGGPDSALLAWFALPLIALPRLGARATLAGSTLTLMALLAATAGADYSGVREMPWPLISAAALCAAVLGSAALLERTRNEPAAEIVDSLTGMLAGGALRARVAELTAQAQISRQPVALVIADVDGLQDINERHGRDAGDAVLIAVAQRVSGELRAYDGAYRCGDDEFLIVLPGAAERPAAELAEALRRAVALDPVRDLEVTVSVGVSVSSGGPLEYEALRAQAGAALRSAKDVGGNRVCTAGPGEGIQVAAQRAT